MRSDHDFDIAFIGQYTKDTIVTRSGTHLVDGGAYFYGACASRRMGLRVAAVTRLAAADFPSFAPLCALRAMIRPIPTEVSTCLKLDYPTDNPDDRILSVTTVAASFEPEDVEGIDAAAWSVGASIRGEVGLPVLRAIKKSGARIGLDAQGYVRIVANGSLAYDRNWPEREEVLGLVDVFKADVVEAEILTGTGNLRDAARILLRAGEKELVLTHGDGVVVYVDGSFHEAPFRPLSLVGRSGRGDTCLASYIAARQSMGPAEATRWAAALTSLKMETVGPFSGSPDDVRTALKERY